MGKVIHFPMPKQNLLLVCAQCGKSNWRLHINHRDTDGGYVTMFCRTRNCGHATNVEIIWGYELDDGEWE